MSGFAFWLKLILGAAAACVVSYLMTPSVKWFAEKVGAIDVPKDERRVHDHPIPRMGGMAIFIGFIVAVFCFIDMSTPVMGMLLGAFIIIIMGAVDDIVSLSPWVKLAGQIAAAIVVIRCGIVFDNISTLGSGSDVHTVSTGWFSVPLTILWIVACTNAVNLIDGLDGLAVGVSGISSLSMLLVSLIVSDPYISIILACLTGACLGFMPYNMNPAKIFMGDVGSQFLGFVLSVVSLMGLFKFHAIITFLIPILSLAVPLADTFFAFFRRLLHGQSPFKADRGHIHHKLLAMGMDQKQAVAVLYGISALFGLVAVLIAGPGTGIRIVCLLAAFIISLGVWLFVFWKGGTTHPELKAKHLKHEDPQ